MGSAAIPGADRRLKALIARLGDQEGARAYLEEIRWPDGVVCPRCDATRIGFLEARAKHYCRDCAYQFRVTAGTVLHDSHLPLEKWLVATGLILRSPRGLPATRLRSVLGGSYKTAWFVEHRIRAAMADGLRDRAAAAIALATPRQSRAGAPPEQDTAARAPDRVSAGYRLIRSIAAGDYHHPSEDYLDAYWAELRWRETRGSDKDAFRATVAALLRAAPLPYDELIRRT